MPAPVQPSELPYWNPPEDPNDVKNPGDAQAELGYKYKDKVPYGWLNWQWKRTYQWLLYLKNFVIDVFNIQHDPTTGFHTNITATDLIVSAGDFQVDADGNVECNDLDCGDVTSLGKLTNNKLFFVPAASAFHDGCLLYEIFYNPFKIRIFESF